MGERVIGSASALGVRVEGAADVLALIGAAYGLDGVLLGEGDLGPAFFELRSGLAGELFQKLTNDGLRAALVLPGPAWHGERFAELAREHARHPLIRFFADEDAARAWLGSS